MNKISGKKQVGRAALLFSAVYMISYITRINYGAVIAEMEAATKLSRSLLSMAVTGSFITYGAGQIVSGICGDRLSPKKLIFCGLAVSSAMNFLLPLCRSPYQMLAVWCVNGFAQAFMWPPLVKLMTALLSEDDYKKVTVRVSLGSSFGTVIVYLVSPLIISALGWKWVFLFSALCGVIMLFVWNGFACDADTPKREIVEGAKNKSATRGKSAACVLFSPLMISIMFAIIFQGMLRDGVTTWMPSYISETYNMSSRISILTGVVLPLFSVLCFQLASVLYRKVLKNALLCAGVIFGAGTLSAFVLLLLSGRSAALSVLFSAALTGCMHGVNLMLINMIPPFFKKQGNVSAVSGVLNSCTYIGSAISTYGASLLSENFSWKYTLTAWFIVGAAGTLLCLISVRRWNRFSGQGGK